MDELGKVREDTYMIWRDGLFPVILVVAFSIGCNKSDQSSQASAAPTSAPRASGTNTPEPPVSDAPASGSDADLIRQAVEDHVRNDRGINMSAMDMSVDSVNVNGDQAQANATFRVKQGGTSMAMVYSLQRHGDGWLVVNGRPSDGQFVHPPMDKTHSGMSPNSSAPGMPDVHEFLKNHPATSNY